MITAHYPKASTTSRFIQAPHCCLKQYCWISNQHKMEKISKNKTLPSSKKPSRTTNPSSFISTIEVSPQIADESSRCCLLVAIDRATRRVNPEVVNHKSIACALFSINNILTDNEKNSPIASAPRGKNNRQAPFRARLCQIEYTAPPNSILSKLTNLKPHRIVEHLHGRISEVLKNNSL